MSHDEKGIGFTDKLSYPNHRRLWVGGFIMPFCGTDSLLTKKKIFQSVRKFGAKNATAVNGKNQENQKKFANNS